MLAQGPLPAQGIAAGATLLAGLGHRGGGGADLIAVSWPGCPTATSTIRTRCGGSSRSVPTRRARCAPRCSPSMITGIAAAWMLLRPAPPPSAPARCGGARPRAAAIVEPPARPRRSLALLGDKNLLFSDDGRGFVMYRPVGRNWIAMGDPVGPPAGAPRTAVALPRSLRPLCGAAGVLPGWRGRPAGLYRCGIRAVQDRRGGARGARRLRPGRARGAQICARPSAAACSASKCSSRCPQPSSRRRMMQELRAVSDRWLTANCRPPRRAFRWAASTNATIRIFPARWSRRDGAIAGLRQPVAAAPIDGELSIDLMRY